MLRKVIDKLNNWYSKTNRKPLVIWGARQVGKTYLIKDLWACKNFDNYVYIDLKKDEDDRAFFSSTCNPSKYLQYIEVKYQKKINNKTPLIFDEVEMCPEVISSLKYFCQDFSDLPVIVTGSMVRMKIKQEAKKNDTFLFPVGKIDSIDVYPMTFEEYLLNINPSLLDDIKIAYNSKKSLDEFKHNIAMDLFYEYLSIGGMPEAVNCYINTRSYVEYNAIIKNIYDNYLEDMSEYNISNETILKTRKIYCNIFKELNKETNHNFKIGNIEKGSSNRSYENAYEWLELSNLIYRSKRIDGKVTLPLTSSNDGVFRLYLSDLGLFNYQGQVNKADFFVKDKRNILSGIFYENYVACELVANGVSLYYWKGKNDFEFEFLIEHDGEIIPIDVKKNKGKLNSLDNYREINNNNVLGIKISNNEYGYNKDRNILTLPHYMAFLISNK